MGDSPPRTASAITSDTLSGFEQAIPAILQAIVKGTPELAKAQLAGAELVSPGYNKLLTELYEKYAPQLAKTGAETEAISRKGAADTDLAILQGSGGAAARSAEALNRELNPEFYASREKAAGKLGELLSSINLDSANPEAERLVSQEAARTGNLATPSATGTVSNALSFGNELQKRRNALSQALSVASGFLPASQSNFGTNVALNAVGRAPSGTGVNQFAGVQGANNAAQAGQAATGIFGNIQQSGDISAQLLAQRRDFLDRFNETSPIHISSV